MPVRSLDDLDAHLLGDVFDQLVTLIQQIADLGTRGLSVGDFGVQRVDVVHGVVNGCDRVGDPLVDLIPEILNLGGGACERGHKAVGDTNHFLLTRRLIR